MFEKISEQEERNDLIKQVKEKALIEINDACINKNEHLKDLIQSDYYSYRKENIREWQNDIMTDLLKLNIARQYIESEEAFTKELKRCTESDTIIYQVSLEYLQMFLLEDFSFADNIINHYNLYTIHRISDRDIVNSDFVSVIEACILKKKLNK